MSERKKKPIDLFFVDFLLGVDLCITYLLDPNEFADLFMAFSATHMNGAEPTDSTLDDFERKDLASYKSRTSNSTARLQRSINEFSEIGSDEEVDDVMGSYICTTPKVRQTNLNGFLCKYYCDFGIVCRHKNRLGHVESVQLSAKTGTYQA